jgi:hypothetical protein
MPAQHRDECQIGESEGPQGTIMAGGLRTVTARLACAKAQTEDVTGFRHPHTNTGA